MDFVLLDGTLAECDRVGDERADYSAKHRRHAVNVQVVTDPDGRLLWLSPALPGRAHDLTAARTHQIIRICERQGSPSWPTSPTRAAPLGDHGHQAQATAGSHPHREDPRPGPGRGTSTSRTRRRTPEVLTDLPQIPVQSEPHDVNRQSHPHPGAATLLTTPQNNDTRYSRPVEQQLTPPALPSRAKNRQTGH